MCSFSAAFVGGELSPPLPCSFWTNASAVVPGPWCWPLMRKVSKQTHLDLEQPYWKGPASVPTVQMLWECLTLFAFLNSFQHVCLPLPAIRPVVSEPVKAWNPIRPAARFSSSAWCMGWSFTRRLLLPVPTSMDTLLPMRCSFNTNTSVSGDRHDADARREPGGTYRMKD